MEENDYFTNSSHHKSGVNLICLCFWTAADFCQLVQLNQAAIAWIISVLLCGILRVRITNGKFTKPLIHWESKIFVVGTFQITPVKLVQLWNGCGEKWPKITGLEHQQTVGLKQTKLLNYYELRTKNYVNLL